jgi:hypothetical protein
MRKRVIGAVAVALVGVVTAGTILSHVSETAYAQESFEGINSIIEEHGETNPFTIVEIVPDYRMAKLGYFFEGSEPYYYVGSGTYQSFQEHLATLSSVEERAAYMSSLKTALSSITTEYESVEKLESAKNATTALSYAPYEESYNAFSGAGTIQLAEPLELAAGTSGYVMTDVGEGKGSYALKDDYHLAEADETGTRYEQNISYYSTAPTNDGEYYYNLTFEHTADPAEGAEVYVVENADLVEITDDQSDWNDIYTLSDGVYVKAASRADDVTDYYRVTFRHAVIEKVTEEDTEGDTEEGTEENTEAAKEQVVYYTVQTMSFDESKSSTYGAILDSKKPYVESEKGYFTCTSKVYTQVGEGEGNYSFDESETGELDGTVKIEKIYYTGGFVNNNLFKQAVFNQSGLLDKAGASDISIRVVVKTASDYNSYTGDADLLYLSYSSQVLQTSDAMDAYGADNDLGDISVDNLYQQVYSDSTRLPVILDYGIMEDSSLNGTGIKKLAALLTADDIKAGNIIRTGNDDNEIKVSVSSEVTEFEDSDHFYVNENVLVVPKESQTFAFMKAFEELFLDDSNKDENAFQNDADAIGFGMIASTIINENTSRRLENAANENNNYGFYNQTISKAIATEYIISYLYRQEVDQDTVLRILDVEPCTITTDTEKEIETNIKKMLGLSTSTAATQSAATTENTDTTKSNDPVFVHMSSAEFISKVEDLGEYDIIYFGLYTDTMNTKTVNDVTRTVFNDSSMDGLVYTNVGDIRYDNFSRGVLDTEFKNKADHYNTLSNPTGSTTMRDFDWNDSTDRDFVRYSGNDITSEKVKAVEKFIKSGSPVILASNFLTTGGDGKTYVYDFQYDSKGNKITKNGNGYIDNCSRMYELIDAIKDKSNVMTESSLLLDENSDEAKKSEVEAKRKVLKRYAYLGKPTLTVDAGSTDEGEEYYSITDTEITFKFNIENKGSADSDAKFYVYLYADYNADGRYAASENIAANDFKISLNGVTQPAKTTTDEDGNDVYYYELSPTDSTTWYRLTYDISESYIGLLPVKLKVSQSTNAYRYDSEVLYFNKKRSPKQSRVEIHVLQILSSSGNASCNMGLKGVYDGTLESYSTFYQQLYNTAEMEDYNITIDAMKATRYLQMYREDPTFLDNYDMLILGFMDCYVWDMSDADRVEAYQGVSDFIATGKSVLFTHDTTSYNNNPGAGKSGWALKALNQLIAPEVGFDRYGAYTSNLLRAGIKNLSLDNDTVYLVDDYYSLKLAKAAGTLTQDSYTGKELFQLIVDEAEKNNKDIAYQPNSDKTALVSEVHGQSSMTINGNSDGTYFNTNASSLGGTPTTTKAELLNEGQILVYPFNIMSQLDENNTITIASTHAQYFQIDMNEDLDGDDESDVTVWLSLYGDNPEYAAASRDARNNYYIYTKGNVTYSGVGHSGIDNSNNLTEIQLYINTMITAYSAATSTPTVSLRQSSDPNSAELSTIYIGMDSKVDAATGAVNEGEQVDSGYERIYYTISDTNVAQGGVKKIAVKYYLVFDKKEDAPAIYQDIGEYLTVDETTVFAVEQNWTTYKGSKTDPEKSLDNITTGVAYACDIPCDILDNLAKTVTVGGESKTISADEATIWVVATTNIWKQGGDTTKRPSSTKSSYDYLKVQRIGLFDLD